MAKEDLNKYIKKSHIKAVEKFWAMDPEHLDAIQNGEAEFYEEEEDEV